MSHCDKHLHVCCLGLAFGVTWGLAILITGLIAWLGDWGGAFVTGMGSLYIGYEGTFIGSIIGGIWGFVDGFIFGVVIAWLYNWFCRCPCFCKKSEDKSTSNDSDSGDTGSHSSY